MSGENEKDFMDEFVDWFTGAADEAKKVVEKVVPTDKPTDETHVIKAKRRVTFLVDEDDAPAPAPKKPKAKPTTKDDKPADDEQGDE